MYFIQLLYVYILQIHLDYHFVQLGQEDVPVYLNNKY